MIITMEIVKSGFKYLEEFGNRDNELILYKYTTVEEIVEFILNGNTYDKKIITIHQYKKNYYRAMESLGLSYEK